MAYGGLLSGTDRSDDVRMSDEHQQLLFSECCDALDERPCEARFCIGRKMMSRADDFSIGTNLRAATGFTATRLLSLVPPPRPDGLSSYLTRQEVRRPSIQMMGYALASCNALN